MAHRRVGATPVDPAKSLVNAGAPADRPVRSDGPAVAGAGADGWRGREDGTGPS